ncbi:glutamate 5-kinase [Alloscardovia macacae]|uniref:Glutamate 5-kinase n=1 Tax=Alloscardovia macacae TaxID=1160091 RepID=A0A1Y2STG5_9BIFI|nr:glutamate 5-kinase [Alloscardovia macacae]OTA26237.1 glutamate 5-kinase [Alloscardovia macacae]OTA28897.1 glutamate 5-kinase [Alloscardovia macacae]
MPWTEEQTRARILQARTVVVKVGSSSLTSQEEGSKGMLDVQKLDRLVSALSAAVQMGARVVLVSSGSVAAGLKPLGFTERPDDSVSRQAAAAVGQGLLMAQYEKSFARFGIRVGQVLMSASDTMRSSRYRNVHNTMERLLELGAVPIVNENDTLVTSEVKFGDNDHLSALVANIVRANALILLSDVDGLYTAPPSEPGARRIPFIQNAIDEIDNSSISGSGSSVGTGGMVTKIDAVRIATASGIPCLLTSAHNAGPALLGDTVGTAFAPLRARESSRRLWIGYASHPQGSVVVDDGAVQALQTGKPSLLAVGTLGVEGEFSAGAPVWVEDAQGQKIARGISAFDSDDIISLAGKNTEQIERFLGSEYARPVIHRDDLVLVETPAQ